MFATRLLLVSAALPLFLAAPLQAAEPAAGTPPRIILAQADDAGAECPQGAECADAEAGESGSGDAVKKRRRRRNNDPLARGNNRGDETRQQKRQRKQELRRRKAAQQDEQEQDGGSEAAQQDGGDNASEGARDSDAVKRAKRRRERLRKQREAAQEEVQEQDGGSASQAGGSNASEDDRKAERRERRQRRRERQRRDAAKQERQQRDTGGQRRSNDGDATVEQQLEAQGDDAEARNVRKLRDQIMQGVGQALGVPAAPGRAQGQRQGQRQARREQRRARRLYEHDERRGRIVDERGGRIVVDLGNGRIKVESVVPDEGGRLLYDARDVEVENLRGGRTRTTIYRRNGARIVTVRNRFGDILRRVRIRPNGREVVLIDNRPDDRRRRPAYAPHRIPPPRVSIPQNQYVLDLGRASRQDIREALLAPPVQRLEQPYALDEVLGNESLRAYSPRIDLDTITFDFGRATIGYDQMDALFALGEVMEQVIEENPDEVYLIEGHTDAVGSDYGNLILSDRRAEAVAVALSQNFYIPPENLVTEGYGEQYLKIPVPYEERRNRRATVRRLTEFLQTSN